jgi:hypothetical protein
MFASILSIPFHEYFRLAPPALRFTQMWQNPSLIDYAANWIDVLETLRHE